MKRIIAGFLCGGLILSAAQAAVIDNEFIRIEQERNTLTLTAKQQAKPSLSAKVTLPNSVEQTKKVSCNDPLWGAGQRLVLKQGANTTTVTLYAGVPFAHLETHIGNSTKTPLVFKKLTMAKMTLDLGTEVEKLKALGTGGLTPASSPEGSYAYSVLADPITRRGVVCGWLTQWRGVGLLLPSVAKNSYHLETQLDFGRLQVKPKQHRETDIWMLGFFADVRKGLENYADMIAKVNAIHLKPKPAVYCTWYHRNLSGSGASTEKMLAENAAFAKKELQPFGLSVFQIDDHWQTDKVDGVTYTGKVKKVGPIKAFVQTNKHFPHGMAATAATFKKAGFIPGIWYMPFAGNHNNPYFDPDIFAKELPSGKPFEDTRWSGTSIDSTSPKGAAFLRARVKRIYDWGYRYIKIDGLHLGTPSKNIYVNRSYKGKVFGNAKIYDPSKTFIEGYRMGMKIIHEEAPDTFVLGCTVSQNMVAFGSMFGLVDAMRVGPDNDGALRGTWRHVTRGADYAGNLWFLNNRVWYNDPDPIYVRESIPYEKAKWMASWLAVSGVMNTTSMQYSHLKPERLDLIKRTLPPHSYPARPIDVLENKNPAIWLVGNDRMQVLGLFNWKEKEETTITYSIERLGLDPKKKYIAFDFWTNQYLGTLQKEIAEKLPPAGCRVLALREAKPYPQLLSTSRHITQGLIEVKAEAWNPQTKTLSGTSDVVAADPYEMRIVAPKGFNAAAIQVSDKSATVSKITQQPNGLIRVTVIPSVTGAIKWSITFR